MANDLDLEDILKIIFQIIYILILLYVMLQVLRAVIGGTWATENIIIAGMGVILAGVFAIAGFLINQGRAIGKIEGRLEGVGEKMKNFEDRLIKTESKKK